MKNVAFVIFSLILIALGAAGLSSCSNKVTVPPAYGEPTKTYKQQQRTLKKQLKQTVRPMKEAGTYYAD
jgi:hypothetical protein